MCKLYFVYIYLMYVLKTVVNIGMSGCVHVVVNVQVRHSLTFRVSDAVVDTLSECMAGLCLSTTRMRTEELGRGRWLWWETLSTSLLLSQSGLFRHYSP